MATGSGPGIQYTSVTIVPPLNFENGQLIIQNVAVTPNSSGQYVCLSISNVTLASLLSQGWSIVAFTY
jgi:hypothetical protein